MTSPSDPAAPPPGRSPAGRAAVVGTGLIGTSIGLALRARGWHVTGFDLDPDRTARSLRMGAIDALGQIGRAHV